MEFKVKPFKNKAINEFMIERMGATNALQLANKFINDRFNISLKISGFSNCSELQNDIDLITSNPETAFIILVTRPERKIEKDAGYPFQRFPVRMNKHFEQNEFIHRYSQLYMKELVDENKVSVEIFPGDKACNIAIIYKEKQFVENTEPKKESKEDKGNSDDKKSESNIVKSKEINDIKNKKLANLSNIIKPNILDSDMKKEELETIENKDV